MIGLTHHNSSVQSLCLFKLSSEIHSHQNHLIPRISSNHLPTSSVCSSEILPIAWKTRVELLSSPAEGGKLNSRIQYSQANHHSDVYKLSEISFGDCDFHIRLNAIQQLNILLTKDSGNFLLSTINRQWCLEICGVCLERIQEFDWYTYSTPPSDQATSTHDLLSPEAEVSLFSLQAIILLRNILLATPDLQENLHLLYTLGDKDTESSIDLTPILISLIKYRFLDSDFLYTHRSILPFDLRHLQLFHLICYEVVLIFSSSLNSPTWTRAHPRWNLFISLSPPMSSGEVNLQLPSFLWDDLFCYFPGQDLLYLYQKYCLQLNCSAVLLHAHHKNSLAPETDHILEPTLPLDDRYSFCLFVFLIFFRVVERIIKESICLSLSCHRHRSDFISSLYVCRSILHSSPHCLQYFHDFHQNTTKLLHVTSFFLLSFSSTPTIF